MVMVKIFDHLTSKTMKFWPWSCSTIFWTMTPGRSPNGQKILVSLPPNHIFQSLSCFINWFSNVVFDPQREKEEPEDDMLTL